jgi:opacity protein-like surface antigen
MTRAPSLFLVIGLAVFALGVNAPVFAQNPPRAEISAGYQTLHIASDIDETLDHGWYADVAGNLSRHLAIVFQAAGNYKTVEETESFGGVTTNVKADLSLYEYMAGVRVNARPNPTVTPFAQFLAGAVRTSADITGSVTGGGQTFFASSSGESNTDAAMQIGGGLNVMMTRALGIRAGADYIVIFSEGEHVNGFRFAAGGVIGF